MWPRFSSATDIGFLPRRVNGLIQLTYSIVIGYALFLTVTQASRRQMARLFLVLSLVICSGLSARTVRRLPASERRRSQGTVQQGRI